MRAMSLVREHHRLALLGLLLILVGCGIWSWRAFLREDNPARITTNQPFQGVGGDIVAQSPRTPVHAIETRGFVEPPPQPRVTFTVMDEISNKPLANVKLFADAARKKSIGQSSKDGSVALEKSVAEGLGRRCFAALPPALGHRNVTARVVVGDGAHQLIVAAYARIVATLFDPHKATRTDMPKRGKLWCATWPTPHEVLGAENKKADWDMLKLSHDLEGLDSDTLSNNQQVPSYYLDLQAVPGCDSSQLIVVGAESETDEDVTVDIPYQGEVITDYFLPGIAVLRSRPHVVPGSLSHIEFVVPDSKEIVVKVVDRRGHAVQKARVMVTVKKTLAPGEPMPSGGFMSFSPTGSDVTTVLFRMRQVTDIHGYARVKLHYRGSIYASFLKRGFVSRGEVLWSDPDTFPSKELLLTVDKAPEGSPPSLLRWHGKPWPNIDLIALFSLTDKDRGTVFHVNYGYVKSDAKGMLDLTMLVPGNRYGLVKITDSVHARKVFVYQPGMTIDMVPVPKK